MAVGILLLVIPGLYIYDNSRGGGGQNTFTFPSATTTTSSSRTTTSTTTTAPPADQVAIESAVINNATLGMKVHNLGPSTTSLLTMDKVCTPGFKVCYNYKGMAGATYQQTFALPAKRSFLVNLTGVCVMPIPSCRGYLPVANMTYYLQVKFSFVDGQSTVVSVSAKANNTWSKHPTGILDISSPSLVTYSGNLSGVLSLSVTMNDSLTELCVKPCLGFTAVLDGYLKPSSVFSGILLTNSSIRCGDDSIWDCSQPIPVIMGFSTVLTGIVPGPYYAVIVRDTTLISSPVGLPNYVRGPSNFAFWVQGTGTI